MIVLFLIVVALRFWPVTLMLLFLMGYLLYRLFSPANDLSENMSSYSDYGYRPYGNGADIQDYKYDEYDHDCHGGRQDSDRSYFDHGDDIYARLDKNPDSVPPDLIQEEDPELFEELYGDNY